MENMEQNITPEKSEFDRGMWDIIFMMLFLAFPFGTDYKTREEVAELKGKVSVLEQLAVADRRG